MTAREKVLQAYGGKCRFCGDTTRLEIDHVFAGGNVHRRTIAPTSLEAWLCHQHALTGVWEPGYQLLCRTHHEAKTAMERTTRMAETAEKKELKVDLDLGLFRQVEVIKVDPRFKTQRGVVTAALTHFFAAEGGEAATRGFQQQLAEESAASRQALGELTQTIQTLVAEVGLLKNACRVMEQHLSSVTKRLEHLETMVNNQRTQGHEYRQLLALVKHGFTHLSKPFWRRGTYTP